MSTTIKTASQQVTESMIFGSGFDVCPWWQGVCRDWAYDETGQAPDGWLWMVTVNNPFAAGRLRAAITHSTIMGAVRRISGGEGGKSVTEETRTECRNVLFRLDEADFDAETADQVMQVAVFGRVVY